MDLCVRKGNSYQLFSIRKKTMLKKTALKVLDKEYLHNGLQDKIKCI